MIVENELTTPFGIALELQVSTSIVIRVAER